MQYSWAHYNAVQCSSVQFSAVQCSGAGLAWHRCSDSPTQSRWDCIDYWTSRLVPSSTLLVQPQTSHSHNKFGNVGKCKMLQKQVLTRHKAHWVLNSFDTVYCLLSTYTIYHWLSTVFSLLSTMWNKVSTTLLLYSSCRLCRHVCSRLFNESISEWVTFQQSAHITMLKYPFLTSLSILICFLSFASPDKFIITYE